MVRILLFATLAALHVALLVAQPAALAPVLAGSVYLPLALLKLLGLPMFAASEGWGWAAPSPAGWAAAAGLWLGVWGLAATMLVRLVRRIMRPAQH